ncbi:MAG: hypothetical protein IE909_08270 [Campylobacterales bacterium]|nr:hypothetical protein [Campylobacterales bacterium]
MAEPTTFRLDPESEMILNQICSQKHLTKSEAIRFVLKNTDAGFEGEKFKKLEQMHTKLLNIFSDVHKQNSTILKTLQNNSSDKPQKVALSDSESKADNKLQGELKRVGDLIRGAQSVELVRAIKNEAPDFYEKFVKLQ